MAGRRRERRERGAGENAQRGRVRRTRKEGTHCAGCKLSALRNLGWKCDKQGRAAPTSATPPTTSPSFALRIALSTAGYYRLDKPRRRVFQPPLFTLPRRASVAHEHARAGRRPMLEDWSELGPLLKPARAPSSGLGILERSWHARVRSSIIERHITSIPIHY